MGDESMALPELLGGANRADSGRERACKLKDASSGA